MYKVDSKRAEEFISHKEILESIEEAKIKAGDIKYVESLIKKGEAMVGLSHREALTLLLADGEGIKERIYEAANRVKLRNYGNRIVLFAPLYLSNYCINGCTYCPYHSINKDIKRRKLSQEEIKNEVIALQDMGHKRLVIEAGEDPLNNPLEYILESIKTIYSIHHKNGDTRRVNVNIAATSVENYKKLKEAGIGTYILFQETYNKESYEALHPTGPKSDYVYHTEAMDRAMEGGIDDVGIGVLFGLNNYIYDFTGLLMHAEHLEACFGVGPHTVSLPRVRPANDIKPEDFDNSLSDEVFIKLVSILRLALPYTGMIISTRETKAIREKLLKYGVTQISGGSKTSVGGYNEEDVIEEDTAQFEVEDKRTLKEVVSWLIDLGYIPSFCTACYREGRTGDRFMSLVKTGAIRDICQPNALITLKEYLLDYGDDILRQKGDILINRELESIRTDKIREITRENLNKIKEGKRDIRL